MEVKGLGLKQKSLFYYYDLMKDGNKIHFKLGQWNEHFPPSKLTGAQKRIDFRLHRRRTRGDAA